METEVIEKTRIKKLVKRPTNYKVLIHNDNKTTFDFVIAILETVFNHSSQSAESLALEVHEKQKAVAGIYSKEIATEKVMETIRLARMNNFPFMATMEPE